MSQQTLDGMKVLLEIIEDPQIHKLLNTVRENAETLNDLVELISKYHRSGTLKTALEMVAFVATVKDAMATHSVARIAETASKTLVIGDQILAEVGGLEGLILIKNILSKLDLDQAAVALNELDN